MVPPGMVLPVMVPPGMVPPVMVAPGRVALHLGQVPDPLPHEVEQGCYLGLTAGRGMQS